MNSDTSYLRPRKRKEKDPFCSAGVLVSTLKDAREILSNLGNGTEKTVSMLIATCVYKQVGKTNIAVVAPVLGAPMAAMILEMLIAKEIDQFLYVGSAGSISDVIGVGDILLVKGAFCQEGTSKHYGGGFDEKTDGTKSFLKQMECFLQNRSISFTTGDVVSTDAPYRETPYFIEKYQKKGAIGVEMEVSALYRVAQYYGKKICALLCISDTIRKKGWQGGFTSVAYRDGNRQMTDVISSWISFVEEKEI